MIIKILLPFIFLLTFYCFSQGSIVNYNQDALSVKCQSSPLFFISKSLNIYEETYLDSVTNISVGYGDTVAFKNKALYLSVYSVENNSFVTKQLKTTKENIKDAFNAIYFKNKNDIYRIRSKKEGEEYLYFKEKLVNDDFEVSTQPFLRGLFSDGFTNDIHIYKNKNNYCLNIFKSYVGKNFTVATSVVINMFDKESFALKSKKIFNFDEKDQVPLNSFLVSFFDDEYFLYYQYNSSSEKMMKLNVIYSINLKDYNQISLNNTIKYKNEDVTPFKSYALIRQNGMYMLSTLKLNKKETELVNELYEINLNESKINLINQAAFPLSINFWRYYKNFSIITDKNNDLYLINYSNRDFLVTKFSNQKIIWSKLTERTCFDFSSGNLATTIFYPHNLDDEIVLTEEKREECNPYKGGMTKMKISINKETGEIK